MQRPGTDNRKQMQLTRSSVARRSPGYSVVCGTFVEFNYDMFSHSDRCI